MKKQILSAVILLLWAALCLAGCATAEERAYEEACLLLESGEYEAAMEAFSGIGMYRQISRKMEEARQLLEEENTEFLLGEWVDLPSGTVFRFQEDGRGTLTTEEYSCTFLYTCDGKAVQISVPLELELKAKKEDGLLHLKDADGIYDLVTMEEYESMQPVTVEITVDNWQEYFVARRAEDVGVDENGRVNHRETGYGIFLKEEYVSRLDLSVSDGSVWFDLEHTYTPYILEGRLDSEDYTLVKTKMPPNQPAYRDSYSSTLPALYRGYQDWRGPQSDFNHALCAFMGDARVDIDGTTYMMLIEEVTVLNAYGFLVLNP